MNKDECKAMCTSPQIPLREKLFFRMIYETTTRPREVLESRFELWNRNTGEITYQLNPRMLGFTWSTGYILCIHKGKYNRWTRRHMPKTMKLTGNTSEMLRTMLGTGRRGIFSLTRGQGGG